MKCKYCGKEYIQKEINILGIKNIIELAQCNCIAEQEEFERQQKIVYFKKEKLKKLISNSMMTPFFQKKKFENVKESSLIIKCKKFANDFNKNVTKGISFVGDVGTGKTTALACLCNYLLESGYSCLFTTFSELLNKISEYSYNHAGNINPILDDICKSDLIFLDDIGRETYTERRKEFAFMLIDRLMNFEKPVCFTANTNIFQKLSQIEEWQAILDRLNDMTVIIPASGESLRG